MLSTDNAYSVRYTEKYNTAASDPERFEGTPSSRCA